MSDGLGERAQAIRKHLKLSQRGMAEGLKISVGGWQRIENGTNVPSGQTLAKLNELGFSADWMLTGRGAMRFDDDGVLEAGQELGVKFEPYADRIDTFRNDTSETTSSTDRELFGRVVDAIQRLYKDERVGLSGVDLGRISAEKYDEIVAATDDPDERMAMVKLMTVQLRNELRARAADPTTSSKRTA